MDTTARRVGKISAISAVLLSAAYIITGSTWFISHFDLVKTSGLLCLTGVVFLVTGNTQFQLPAILGYAFGFPSVCLLLVILFSRSELR